MLSKKEVPRHVFIWDETLRDGEQSPGVSLNTEQKLEIAKLLDECNVKVIDVGFPLVSENERHTIKRIVSEKLNADIGVTIRAKKEDVDCALTCDVNEVHIFLSTSDLHLKHKFGITREEAFKQAVDSVEYALSHGLIVDFIAEDTARSNVEFVCNLFNQLHELGTDKMMISDTVGIMNTEKISQLVSNIIENTNPKIKYGIHCHNDFGLATANTLAAVQQGVIYPTVTVNGIGERAGNAAFEEVVCGLERLHGIKTGVKMEKLNELSELVQKHTGMLCAVNKPIVGYNAFRHESGIHVDAMLKKAETYEVLNPELVGAERSFVLGKHSGGSVIRSLTQQKGLYLSDQQINLIRNKVKEKKESYKNSVIQNMLTFLNEYNKSVLGFPEDDLWKIVEHLESDENCKQLQNES